MNKEEAHKVIEILLKCDSGCEYCAADQVKLFCKEFPDLVQDAEEAFLSKFGKSIDEVWQTE